VFDWFAGLDPQVQSGWIAGITAMTTTVLTVSITQYFSSRNVNKTLTENRETARETIEANGQALDRTLATEAAKHRAELEDRQAERTHTERMSTAFEVLGLLESYKYITPGDPIPYESESFESSELFAKFSVLYPERLRKQLGRLVYEGYKIAHSDVRGMESEHKYENSETPNDLEEAGKFFSAVFTSGNQRKIYRDNVNSFLDELRKELGTYREDSA